MIVVIQKILVKIISTVLIVLVEEFTHSNVIVVDGFGMNLLLREEKQDESNNF